MDREQVRAWAERWKAVGVEQHRERRRESPAERLQQLDALYHFYRQAHLQWPETDEEAVWERWQKLRERHARVSARGGIEHDRDRTEVPG